MTSKDGTKIITLRTDEQTKFQIEVEAHRQGRSVNNFLNFIVKQYLEGEKNKGRA